MPRTLRDSRLVETIYGIETTTPTIPARAQIGNVKLAPSKQKFELTAFDPTKFEPTRFDQKKFDKLPAEEQEAFAMRELERRLNGYWLMINGELTWLPGGYYFELCYWHIDIGLKDYRDRDRRKWLFWTHAVGDPNCFGVIYMKHRRDGATHWANCINFETASRTKAALTAIQSKTGKDAAKVFNKLVFGFRKMASFFVPIFDGNDKPRQTLSFEQPSQRITKNQKGIKQSEALDTSASHYPTVDDAVDGLKLVFYHGDEAGKTVEMDVSKAWPIIRECLSVGAGTRIVGKALYTSTVAEGTKKGGDRFKKLWDQSNPQKRNKNGRTISGLYNLFIMAADGLEGFIGEYGESIIDAPTPAQLAYLRKSNPGFNYQPGVGALQHILNERQGLRDADDAEGLAEHRRLYPLTEQDAFTPPSAECLFDRMKLDAQSDVLMMEPTRRWVRGEFIPEDRADPNSPVRFVLKENGNWYVNKKIVRYDETTGTCLGYEFANMFKRRGDILAPNNKNFGVGGVDPVDHDGTTNEIRASKFAASIFAKYSSLDPDNSHKHIARYVHRAGKAEVMYEDARLAAIYFGIQWVVENQKIRFIKHMQAAGCGQYLMGRPVHTHTKNTLAQKEVGVPSSDLIHVEIHDEWEEYICDHSDKIDDEAYIADLQEFDINETRKSDLTMAGGFALIGARKFKFKSSTKPEGKKAQAYVRVFNKRV